MKKEETTFFSDARRFNEIYKLPIKDKPTLPEIQRLKKFKEILLEEVDEIDEIVSSYERKQENLTKEDEIELLAELSDWLGDMVVYIGTECVKYGINLNQTLKIIMESNFSKLGDDGKPIYDDRGKVLKGPNYWKPQPKIAEFVKESLPNQ